MANPVQAPPGNSAGDLIRRARRIGPRRTVRQGWRRAVGPTLARWNGKRLGARQFTYQGRSLAYAVHGYGFTWLTERAVEIPLAHQFLSENHDVAVLEVGNVMSHYGGVGHAVLDKYDDRDWVINEDVVEFDAAGRYDALLSISTLEHVGFDETPRDDDKLPRVLARLHELVNDPQRVLVTLPIGYNPTVDRLILKDALPFAHQGFLMREGGSDWLEVGRDEALGCAYRHRTPSANAILVGRGLRPAADLA